MLGPPLGGAAIGLLGPVVTLVTDAVSYLLSATALRAIGDTERLGERLSKRPAHPGEAPTEEAPADGTPPEPAAPRLRARDLLDGWRYILTSPALRPLFLNTILVNGLIMATAPLLLVLMVGELGFTPWQYGLAFALPCVGGLIGSRLARRLVARHGQHRVLLATGALRACWPVGLAFIHPGATGLVLVMAVELGLITCMGVFNPVMATYRLDETPPDRVARTLSAWSVTSKLTIAALTALWGLLAAATGPRTAVAAAGALLLATPLLLPRHRPARPSPKDDTAELKG
jgi:predicted MFS family arabinose efflux permease